MAEIKGSLIPLTAGLMSVYPEAIEKADRYMFEQTGRTSQNADPEGWYDSRVWAAYMDAYVDHSVTRESALITLGKRIYPMIKASGGLPGHLRTPLEYILFEADGFLAHHRGPEVRPRHFVKTSEGHVVVRAEAPGYNPRLYEGVYLGILGMLYVNNARCEMTNPALCEFEITWS